MAIRLLGVGVKEYIKLDDTPDSYSGQAGKTTKVKTGEDGLEFTDFPEAGFTSRVFAYRSGSTQTIPSASWTVVQFNAEEFDGDGEYDHENTYRFTAGNSGYYLVSATLKYDAMPADTNVYVCIYKNGARYIEDFWRPKIADSIRYFRITAIIYLAANDYITIRTWQESGANKTLSHVYKGTRLCIHRLS